MFIESWNGTNGTACLMLVKNVKEPKKDYELSQCPICGQDVWVNDLARDLKEIAPHIKFSCTECAIKED